MDYFNLENEVWKDIIGFHQYQVSSLGRVRNKTRMVLKSLYTRGNGYLYVSLSINNRSYSIAVHKLVIDTFKTNDKNYKTRDHINLCSLDNRSENLRYANQKMQNLNQMPKIQKGVLTKTKCGGYKIRFNTRKTYKGYKLRGRSYKTYEECIKHRYACIMLQCFRRRKFLKPIKKHNEYCLSFYKDLSIPFTM